MKIWKISYRAYTLIIFSVLALIILSSIVVSYFLESLSGDLTRIGFYSENDYGWSGKEYRYESSQSEAERLGRSYDIAVIGDSFSIHTPDAQTPVGGYWTSSLAIKTGMSLGVFHVGNHSLSELIDALTQSDNPPKVLIYQIVERDLKSRLGSSIDCSVQVQYLPINELPTFKKLELELESFERNKRHFNSDYGYAIKYIFAQITNHRFGSQVIEEKLTRDDLFSNKKSNHVLYLRGDLKKSTWSSNDWAKIKCNAIALQNKVQANRKTRFVLMISPDKSTVYAPFFARKIKDISKLNVLETKNLNFLRLDELLIHRLYQGQEDLYLPNDTHWSFYTHSLVADELVKFLKALNSR